MKYPFFSEKFFKFALIISTAFCALSAFGGGLGLIFMDGLGMPKSYLGGIFSSFLIPGLVLLIVVGGANLFSSIVVKRNWRFAMESAMVAGFSMQIWIYVEMYIIRQSTWLQTMYFASGTLTLILAFMLYGRKR